MKILPRQFERSNLERMQKTGNVDVEPDTLSFNIVIHAWSRRREPFAANRAEAILARMQELYEAGNTDVKPTPFVSILPYLLGQKVGIRLQRSKPRRSFSACKSFTKQAIPDVKPDTISFNAVLSAWANSRDPSAAKRTEAILEYMQELYDAGNVDVKPNTICFNSAISAWAKTGDPAAVKRAEAILQRMQELYEAGNTDVKPDTISLNAVLSVWANSRDPSAAKRAEAILARMQELYDAGNVDVKPNTISFNTVLSVWAKSGDPVAAKRAEGILQHMQKLCKAGNSDVKPNTISFNSCAFHMGKESRPSGSEAGRSHPSEYAATLRRIEIRT